MLINVSQKNTQAMYYTVGCLAKNHSEYHSGQSQWSAAVKNCISKKGMLDSLFEVV